jgi:hypothetical protein
MEYDDKTGKAIYNLNKAESWLVHEYFALCPRIKLQLDLMSYLDKSTYSQARKELRSFIPQLKLSELPQKLQTNLLHKIANRIEAQQYLEDLNRAVVIMKDVIVASRVTGDTKLWSILMLRDDVFGDIELQHVDAVFDILHAQIDTSEFPGVQNIYKYKLTDTFRDNKGNLFPAANLKSIEIMKAQAHGQCKEKLSNVLSFLRDYYSLYLGKNNIDPGLGLSAIPEMLAEDELQNIFSTLFMHYDEESCLRMGHFCKVFKLLDAINVDLS